jgi:hypothetical protein
LDAIGTQRIGTALGLEQGVKAFVIGLDIHARRKCDEIRVARSSGWLVLDTIERFATHVFWFKRPGVGPHTGGGGSGLSVRRSGTRRLLA